MITNIFVSWFVVTAFLYMTVVAWVQLIKVGQLKIAKETSAKMELAFLVGIFLLINVISVGAVWYLDRISTLSDEMKAEQIEEALDYMELLS